ncbi:GCN5-related N-acetyltransferase [Fimbriimonas ginsengisoli Gsoil 348]|uniref:GCN5-related N-acetyltransferase n=2 Tax=Fimbriimonas ginsengisoli TaxID=1005039 RepID=A0A068NX95_FIMGI|nr:GCN5-related N-acetyltransferase [Fimbriimonas ginsengisoli Gsoil 348]
MDAEGVDWEALTRSLIADDFSNGRTPDELRRSFENSHVVCFARVNGQVVGKGRLLSDSVCNAYLVDMWTSSNFRRRGIARTILSNLVGSVPGQHVYLQADDDLVDFYEKLGFHPHPNGMARVEGAWLNRV